MKKRDNSVRMLGDKKSKTIKNLDIDRSAKPSPG